MLTMAAVVPPVWPGELPGVTLDKLISTPNSLRLRSLLIIIIIT